MVYALHPLRTGPVGLTRTTHLRLRPLPTLLMGQAFNSQPPFFLLPPAELMAVHLFGFVVLRHRRLHDLKVLTPLLPRFVHWLAPKVFGPRFLRNLMIFFLRILPPILIRTLLLPSEYALYPLSLPAGPLFSQVFEHFLSTQSFFGL